MPNKTFYNLPEDKRTLIENAAIDEFSTYDYNASSVNRIVEQSGIAKGSFYQYFSGKKDLFLYIVSRIGEKKLLYLTPTMQNPEDHDFFTLMRELYVAALQFSHDHPKCVKLGAFFMDNKSHPLYGEIMGSNLSTAEEFYEHLIILAMQRGEIRPIENTKLLSKFIATLALPTTSDFIKPMSTLSSTSKEFSDALMAAADFFIDFIKRGIRAN